MTPTGAGAVQEVPALAHRWTRAAFAPLAPGEVHVWSVDLDHPPDESLRIAEVLSPEERERAARFRFDRDRSRFMAGRSTLRSMIGAYLGAAPSAVELRVDEHGKPHIAQASAAPSRLRFNVAHADRLALVAFVADHDVGVDVERIEALPDAEAIAEGYFARSERDTLGTLGDGQKADAFYRCWTRKEAYLKAIGLGLAAPLDRFAVTMTAGAPARLVQIDGDLEEAARWAVYSLDPAEGYCAALAIRAPGLALRCARWAGAESASG